MLKYGYETLRRSFYRGCCAAQLRALWAQNTNHLLELHLDLSVDLSHLEQHIPCTRERERGRRGGKKKNAWRTLNSTKSSERAGKKQKRRKNWEDTPACKLMQVTQEHVKKNIRDKWFCNRGQRRCTWWKLARGNRRQSGWDDNKWWRARRMRGQNASKSNPAWAPKSRGDQTCRLFFFFLLLSLITFWRQANATRGNKINTSKKGYSLHTRGGERKKKEI